MLQNEDPEALLETAASAVRCGDGFEPTLDSLNVPIYVTDADGSVTYWNRACVEFAGREPQLGRDRWCVTWKLFTTEGEPLAHEECPMAKAIRQCRPIRDEIAIAMRPDGSRVAFRPYPTPIMDSEGNLTAAINMLIDISEQQAESLMEQAGRCRRLACATHDRRAADVLASMADGYESTAAALQK